MCSLASNKDGRTENEIRGYLSRGELEDMEVDMDMPPKQNNGAEKGITGTAIFDFSSPSDFARALTNGAKAKKSALKKRMKVSQARPILEVSDVYHDACLYCRVVLIAHSTILILPDLISQDQEAEKLLEDYDIMKEAINAVEENGIVFIDEIDKIVSSGDYRGADASSEGVQRDLLPLIEVH